MAIFRRNKAKDRVEILLVEDSPGDARLAIEALKESSVDNNLHHVADGEEAIDFLYMRGKYHDAPRPNLILLDLNLPKINGLEVLAHINSQESLSDIPVVVLSISESESDIERSYKLNARSYITKPLYLDDFIEVFERIKHFWLKPAIDLDS